MIHYQRQVQGHMDILGFTQWVEAYAGALGDNTMLEVAKLSKMLGNQLTTTWCYHYKYQEAILLYPYKYWHLIYKPMWATQQAFLLCHTYSSDLCGLLKTAVDFPRTNTVVLHGEWSTQTQSLLASEHTVSTPIKKG